MSNALLVIFTLFDMAILAVLYFILKRKSDGAEILAEITEERRVFAEMLMAAKEEMGEARHTARQTLAEIKHYAAEIEQEIKNSKDTIGTHMSEIIAQLSQQVDKPLMELTQKQNALEVLGRKLAGEKKRLIELLAKAEKICKFFNEDLPYEEVVKEIEHKKYADARKLLAQGLPQVEIAKELHLSLSEVEILSTLAQR